MRLCWIEPSDKLLWGKSLYRQVKSDSLHWNLLPLFDKTKLQWLVSDDFLTVNMSVPLPSISIIHQIIHYSRVQWISNSRFSRYIGYYKFFFFLICALFSTPSVFDYVTRLHCHSPLLKAWRDILSIYSTWRKAVSVMILDADTELTSPCMVILNMIILTW